MISRIGDEVQRLSVVSSIPDLLLEDYQGCITRVFPKMQQVLPSGSTEFHVAMSETIRSIVINQKIPVDVFVQNFLSSIISSMDNKDHVVANAWSDTLVAIMDLLPVNVVQSDMIPLASNRAQLNKSVPVRLSSCKLLGKLITRLDPVVAKRDVLPIILSLCQDINGDVRACMATQLEPVIKHLGPDICKSTVLHNLIELSQDELRSVREAAFTTAVATTSMFPFAVVQNSYVPMFNQILNTAFRDDEMLVMVVSLNYGDMCLSIKPFVSPNDKEAYLKWFVIMCESGMASGNKKGKGVLSSYQNTGERFAIFRQNCAQNFPKVVQFAWEESNDHYYNIIQPTLTDLVSDPFYMVRRMMGAGMLQAIKILDKSAFRLKKEFLSLLRDDSEEVIEGLMPTLSKILLCFTKFGVFKKDTMDSSLIELNRTLHKCEGILVSTHNWRLYASFLKEMEVIHRVFPSEVVFTSFISLLFKRIMTSRAVPVRLQALRTIIINLRHLNKATHRSDVRNKILNDLRGSHNFYDRMIYIRGCDTIMETFSTNYFREYFFQRTINLVDDPVPNIRWGLCRMLPRLKAMTRVPGCDKKFTTLIDQTIAKLNDDTDKEVQNQLNAIKNALDRADPAHFFPNDGRLLDEENAMPTDYAKPVETKMSLEVTVSRNAVQPPPARRLPQTTSSASLGSRGSSTTSISPNAPDSTSIPPVSLTDQQFLVDAGVILSSQSNDLKVVRRLPVRLKEANENALMKASLPKPIPYRQGIPIRQSKNINALSPSRPQRQRDAQNQNKRHSIEVMDVNKNLMKAPTQEESERKSPASPRRQSHLPRPLSCINFPAKSDDFPKSRPASRLPVSRQRF